MRVIKRTGDTEEVSFDKVLNRIRNLSNGLNVDIFDVTQKVCSRIYDNVKTSELDELTAQICSSMILDNPDYGILASRIIVSNHHKNTSPSFSETIITLYNNIDSSDEKCSLVSDELYNIVMKNKEKLNVYIDYSRDYNYDYFGFKTLERSYLLKINDKIIERPQHMLMRVSLGIHGNDFKDALATYDYMSKKYFTHATPTLFNSGTPRQQNSSCFLISMIADSVDGIFDTLKECAHISKYAGGIGLHIHNIRAKGSRIRGTNGTSDGIVPMLKVYNNTAKYINQSGKRNGSIAVYLEPWHADIESFIDMKKNHGNEEDRARDLFYALWVPDLFMKRVKEDKMWSLMCPDICKGLSDVHSQAFEDLYTKYESEGKYVKQIKAQDLWFKILETQIETGVPYLMYKDACNMKSNQQNLGTIKSSNLCVAPDTMILTSEGYKEIQTLKDQKVEVWNGAEFSETTLRQTGVHQKLITIKFDNGVELKCTPYHKFYVDIDNAELIVEARYLKNNMQLSPFKLPNSDIINIVKIESIMDEGYYDDTYCFNEPKEHKGIFNGILTGNCTEIVEYTDAETLACCNLASICLPTFIKYENQKPIYDFEKLHEISMIVTKNLNKVIDVNYYPLEKAKNSNLKHRPLGIGVQGLADTFILMRYPFDSKEAIELNKQIFETIYHGAVEESMLIAKKRSELYDEAKTLDPNSERFKVISTHLDWDNQFEPFKSDYPGSYSSFIGSPASKGLLQFDLWNVLPSDRYDWNALKSNIAKYGMRNSLLLAPMPTASTSQIMGFNEAIEPITSNIYKRKTMAGEFVIVNKYLLKDLISNNLWNKDMRDKIVINEGSIQDIEEIPDEIKALYKTVWELSQKVIIDMAADRGIYICQSQSMNLFVSDPDFKKLTSMHFYAFSRGLKTGCYYLRSKPKAKVQKFTIDPSLSKFANVKEEKKKKKYVCTDDVCTSCSG